MRLTALCVPPLLCMLLSMAACQKFDASDYELPKGENKTGVVGDDGGNSHGGGVDDDRQPELQPDGTMLYDAKDHAIILLSHNDDGKDHALFVSLCEWHDVASALSDEGGQQAQKLAETYSEGGVRGWRMPTRDEAQTLHDLYECGVKDDGTLVSDTLKALNARIESLRGVGLRVWERRNSLPAYRYLCEDGTHTFSLKENTKVSTAGKKSLYHLRLVKDTVMTKL